MGMLSRLFGKQDAAERDARRVYNAVMKQSRQTAFYGHNRFPDNYDGRIDVLTLHMGMVFESLRRHGEQGNRLAQALFDEMKDDFEIALREEGLSDTGVAKRIKPMIQLFYTRVKAYTENFEAENFNTVVRSLYAEEGGDAVLQDERDASANLSPDFTSDITRYVEQSRAAMKDKTLGQLAQAEFDFPEFQSPT